MIADHQEKAEPRRPSLLSKLRLALLDPAGTHTPPVRSAAAMCRIGKVTVFQDPEAALYHIWVGSRLDVMLVAWDEPLKEGLSFCRTIRHRRSSPRPYLPIVMVSKHTTIEHVRKARDAGVDEFLAHPFSTDVFRRRLSAIVEQRRGFVDVKGYFGPDRRRGAIARMLGAERRSDPTELIDPFSGKVYLDC